MVRRRPARPTLVFIGGFRLDAGVYGSYLFFQDRSSWNFRVNEPTRARSKLPGSPLVGHQPAEAER